MSTDIKNRLCVALAQRGNTGKSTALTCLGQWYSHHQLAWTGFDLDPDHQSFSRAFPENVRLLPLSDEPTSDLVRTFKAALQCPLTTLDPRAHMSNLLLDAFESTGFLKLFSEQGGRVTAIILPADDLEVMMDIDRTLNRFGGAVDYLVIRNSFRAPKTNMLNGSELEQELVRLNAGFVQFPALLATARNMISAKEISLGRAITHVEAVANAELKFDPMVRVIIEHWIRDIFRQFDVCAKLLLTTDRVGSVTKTNKAKPSEATKTTQRGARLNLGGMNA